MNKTKEDLVSISKTMVTEINIFLDKLNVMTTKGKEELKFVMLDDYMVSEERNDYTKKSWLEMDNKCIIPKYPIVSIKKDMKVLSIVIDDIIEDTKCKVTYNIDINKFMVFITIDIDSQNLKMISIIDDKVTSNIEESNELRILHHVIGKLGYITECLECEVNTIFLAKEKYGGSDDSEELPHKELNDDVDITVEFLNREISIDKDDTEITIEFLNKEISIEKRED